MDVENVPSLKNLSIQSVVMSLMKALEKRMELLGELETDDSDQETIIDGMLENSDNTEMEETETLKQGTDNSDNGKVEASGENLLVLSYGDDKISCDMERHSGLESGNDFNGKGQFEGSTDKSDGSENKFAMDKQDGSEGVVNRQIKESVFGGDNVQDIDFAMDKKE